MSKEETRIRKVLEDMSYAMNHIEDMVADNRAIIVKLVKQNNTIVEFLKNLELQIDEDYGIESPPTFDTTISLSGDRVEQVREMLEQFKSQSKELKEFEKELKKHKNKLTPGQIGES